MLPPCHLLVHLIFSEHSHDEMGHSCLVLSYLSIILMLRFPLQTLMATNSKPVLATVSVVNIFPVWQHSCLKPHSLQLWYSTICAKLREFFASHNICMSLPHWHILSLMPCLTETSRWCCVPRLRAAAVGCVDAELKSKAYELACSHRKNNSELVVMLPFAHLVIFNLDMKTKAAFTYTEQTEVSIQL